MKQPDPHEDRLDKLEARVAKLEKDAKATTKPTDSDPADKLGTTKAKATAPKR